MNDGLEYYKRLTEKYKADSLQLVKENKELEHEIIQLKTRIETNKTLSEYTIEDNSIKYQGEKLTWNELCNDLNNLLTINKGLIKENNELEKYKKTNNKLEKVLNEYQKVCEKHHCYSPQQLDEKITELVKYDAAICDTITDIEAEIYKGLENGYTKEFEPLKMILKGE